MNISLKRPFSCNPYDIPRIQARPVTAEEVNVVPLRLVENSHFIEILLNLSTYPTLYEILFDISIKHRSRPQVFFEMCDFDFFLRSSGKHPVQTEDTVAKLLGKNHKFHEREML